VDLTTREAELEEVTDALILTDGDDFNALAAYELRKELGSGHVFRLPAAPGLLDLVPKYAEGGILFSDKLTFAELSRRFEAGAHLVEVPGGDASGRRHGLTPLFFVTSTGALQVVTPTTAPTVSPGDRMICLADGREP
jgi:hypothetical protein